MSTHDDDVEVFQYFSQRLSVQTACERRSVVVGAKHQKDRGFRDMPLIAAQSGETFSALLVSDRDDGHELHIYPVRGCLHGLNDLSHSLLRNRRVLIGTDGTVSQQAFNDGIHTFPLTPDESVLG